MNESSWFTLMNLILPGLISTICKPNWSNQAKYLTALGISFLAALGQLYLQGACSWGDLPGTLAKTFVLVMGSYAIFWRPTGLAQKVEEKING